MLKNLAAGILAFAAVAALLLPAFPVQAALIGFVARDDQDHYFEYAYDALLDSYALKLLGRSDGLYDYYMKKQVYALKDSKQGYIDYQDVLDRYAAALAGGEYFDLDSYTESGKAKRAEIPAAIKLVSSNNGNLVFNSISTVANNPKPGSEPPKTGTPIVGAAGVTVEQARIWAGEEGAHQRLIDMASLYWAYAEITGIRPEVLYAQAAYETDFGHFSARWVTPDHHNWAGILKAEAGGNEPLGHEIFADPEDGVRGHFNHMSAYVGLNPVGEPHGRYHLVTRLSWAGTITYVEELSGKWRAEQDYHLHILSILDRIINTNPVDSASEKKVEEPGSEPEREIEVSINGHVAVDVSEVTVLHLRSGPGTDYEILDRLVRGTVLQVIGSEGIWFNVITPADKTGWVHGDYVQAINMAENPFLGKTIAVDPGHGGSDSGSVGAAGLQEKVLNLAVAKNLQKLLETAGAKVIMTRSGDQSIGTSTRIEMVNKGKADVFVSIHANAFTDPASNGTETYYCANNDHSDAGRYLAQQLQRELLSTLGLRDRGVKARSFPVLTETEMPSALVELGFLTNAAEEEFLARAETQVKAADAIFRGLEAYLRKYR